MRRPETSERGGKIIQELLASSNARTFDARSYVQHCFWFLQRLNSRTVRTFARQNNIVLALGKKQNMYTSSLNTSLLFMRVSNLQVENININDEISIHLGLSLLV